MKNWLRLGLSLVAFTFSALFIYYVGSNLSIEARGVYAIESKKDGIVRISNGESKGTGFFIDENLIVTNAHVVGDYEFLSVQSYLSDKTYPAIVLSKDVVSDIALVEIVEWPKFKHEVGFEVLKLELDQSKIRTGDTVFTYGHPGHHDWTLSQGIISHHDRHIMFISPVTFIQTDAEIHPGNSGGPIFNYSGNVVGINTIYFPESEAGYSIRSDSAQKSITDIIEYGKVKWGKLGIQFQVPSLEIHPKVEEVEPDGPAAKAHVESGDLIVSIDGRKVYRISEVQSIVLLANPGDELTLVVERSGKEYTAKVTLVERIFDSDEFERDDPIEPPPEDEVPNDDDKDE